MNDLLIGLLSILAATNQVLAASQAVDKATGAPTRASAAAKSAPGTNDPVELEYQQLMERDDKVQAEVDLMIRTDHAFAEKGLPYNQATLQFKVDQKLAPVQRAYEDFIQRNPKHARARLAFGSFLNDQNKEKEAVEQWEKARELDPANPAVWNNLANYYGHRGPAAKAFEYYTKAIELQPEEAVYYHNFGTTVFLYRKDAQEFFKATEQQVFDRTLELYNKSLKLDPGNFPLATDIAQTYYGITPLRTNDAIAAWNTALKLANDDVEREGIHVHLARFNGNIGRFDEARAHLNKVTNSMYNDLKTRLAISLDKKELKTKGTNAVPAVEAPAQPFKPAP